MIRDIYENIIEEKDIRKNLIELRKEIKNEDNKRALLYCIGSDFSPIARLLSSQDPKTRKNIALIIGELNLENLIQELYTAYKNEETLFVKSSYLVALENFDYRDYVDELSARLNDLIEDKGDEVSRKHVNEEIRIISNLLIKMDRPKEHEFTGYNEMSKLILLTNRDHKEITAREIKNGEWEEINAGVMVATKNINEVLNIRTYSEVLFLVDDIAVLEGSPNEIADAIAKSSLLEFLTKRHMGKPPFYFRIELKSKMQLDKKSALTKKIAMEIERITSRQLINTTSNYEFEIRLIENKSGFFHVMIKLYTIKDIRFLYRKNAIATSISPSNAALVVAIAKEYMKEDAQILDPFCGVGTMLIERNKVMPANPMYGLDIFGDAIEKARENAELDKTIINFINRDFFNFKHEYLFDEVITNMPSLSARKDENEVSLVFKKFFDQVKTVLKVSGIIIMHTKDKTFVNRYLNINNFKIEKVYELSEKERTNVFVIRYLG